MLEFRLQAARGSDRLKPGLRAGGASVFLAPSCDPGDLRMSEVSRPYFFLCLTVFVSGRFVPAQAALTSAVPASRRGGYMSRVTCPRDFCSGLAAILAGAVVELTPEGLLHVDRVGWLAAVVSLISIWLIRRVRNVSEVEAVRTPAAP